MFGTSFFPSSFFARTYFPGSTAFTTWLARESGSRIVLCELQPAEALSGWAAVGGTANTYSIAWSSIIQSDVVAGGVYRRLDFVRQNGTTLTERSSVAAVDANAGSYYFDEGAGLLYVHTTSGSDPDLFAFVGAFFSLFLATEPVDFVGGQLYEPRLTGALPEVRAEVDDPLFGVAIYPSGDVEVSNADRFFDRLVRRYIWKNKTATFRLGGRELAFAEYQTVAVMKIEDLAPGDAVCRFQLRALASLLDKILPLNTIGSTEFANVADGVEGTYKPLLLGSVEEIAAPLVDDTVGAEVYLVSDPVFGGMASVSAVRAKNRTTGAVSSLSLTSDYTVNLAAGTVTIVDAGFAASAYEIRIDASGPPNGSGGALSRFGELSRALLLALGESADNLDAGSFTRADLDNTCALGLWIVDPKPAAEHIRTLERSVLGSLTLTIDGKWSARIWNPDFVPADLEAFADEDFVRFEPDDKIENVCSIVRVKYGHRPASGAWSVASHSSAAVQYAYETTDAVTLETALRSTGDAESLAQRYGLIAASPAVEVEIEERGLRGMALNLFDKVLVTRRRAPALAGVWTGQLLEVLAITKTLAPPRVTMRLGDLRGFAVAAGHWAPDTTPAYGSASEDDRAAYGFWTDDNGYIVPGDATTRDRSQWW